MMKFQQPFIQSTAWIVVVVFALFLLIPDNSKAMTSGKISEAPSRRFRVALFERPPYVFKDKEGHWTGLSIDLWEQIAGLLGISYDYEEVPMQEVIKKLHQGDCDLCPEFAISGEYAGLVEFTEPYLFSHGAVMTQTKSVTENLRAFYSYLWRSEVLLILLAMLAGMAVFSLVLMLVERRRGSGHFSGPTMSGFGSALWFSAVTMTTVGYGDKTPVSMTGRMITFIWMLAGVLLIALFTGTVASSITTAEMQSGVMRFHDLSHFRVGCIEGSRMDLILKTRGVPARRFSTPEDAYSAFVSKSITAYAGDSITLEYLMTHNAPGQFRLNIIPDSAMIYAFATRPDLPELTRINRSVLEISLAPDWRTKAERWTGPLSF